MSDQVDDAPLVVLTNLPDIESASALARALVDARVAACVNVLSPVRSVYRWAGKIEEAAEVPLLIKTRRSCFEALEQAIRVGHPYEVPEIIALPIERGFAPYLAWIAEETTS